MSDFDKLHRFLFTQANVRGELVRLDESLNQIVHSYEYPVQIQTLLSEMTAATSLLTATLKFKGVNFSSNSKQRPGKLRGLKCYSRTNASRGGALGRNIRNLA